MCQAHCSASGAVGCAEWSWRIHLSIGLGKTVQALALAAAYKDEWPGLVITPSSLRREPVPLPSTLQPVSTCSGKVMADNSPVVAAML